MSNLALKIKRTKPSDVASILKLPFAALASRFYKIKHRDLWIVCEDAFEARDNGFWFFKYVRENYPNQDVIYAIKKESVDYDKVASLGKTVEFGSFKHWIYYLASTKKISSQKAGNPNAAVFYMLEVRGILKDKRVFLQHGIVKDDSEWLYYENTKMARFVCGCKMEHEYVKERFHYPEENLAYTGLCRFDGLHNIKADKKLILIMPTWREWIAHNDGRMQKIEGTNEFTKTNYFKNWVDFISDKKLRDISDKYGVRFVFFPHRNMQKYLGDFPESDDCVEIAGREKYDVQYLLKNAALMITDYSSVFFDFIYMKKPVIYYQFDYDVFRANQYGEGYFDYRNNPFGKSLEKKDDVYKEIEDFIQNDYRVSEQFEKGHKDYFELFDTDNCKRTYEMVKAME